MFNNLDSVVKAIVGLGTASIFLQTDSIGVGSVANADLVKQIGDLGVKGLLAVAVVILWKKFNEREDIILNLMKTLADALAGNKSNIEKMSGILDDMQESIERMNNLRNNMPPKN